MESPFRQSVPQDLKVIETLGFRPDEGFVRLDRHLERLATTCAMLGISCDIDAVRAKLDGMPDYKPLRIRVTIDVAGALEVTGFEMPQTPDLWKIAFAETRLDSNEPWLQLKTTKRGLYDRARAALPKGVDELVFLNEKNEVCEGTITNVFADFGAGLVTPPTSCGLLAGVLRGELLDDGARLQTIRYSDLADAKQLYVGNSLRGLIPARLV